MNYDSKLAMSRLRKEFGLPSPHEEGFGEVHFHTESGRVVKIDNVRVDSVSAEGRTIVAEDCNGDLIHIPFVLYWTVHYRF